MRKVALFWFGLVVTALVALGLVVLSSASEANGVRLHADAYYFMKRQGIYLVVGVLVAVCAASFDYHKWRDYQFLTWLFYAVTMAGLVAVFGFKAVNGSHRWIAFGPIRIQPGEIAKLLTVILVSVWLDKAGWRVELFRRGAFWPAVLIGSIAVPILLEPDFGSVMVVGLAGGLVMLVAGVRILHMVPFLALGGGVFVYKVVTNANRMARMAAFLGVKIDVGAEVVDAATRRAAYQAHQALVAIGNGGIRGVGLNQSMQKHYYLPEAHTDFIFAIGAEELGLAFSVTTVLLFVAFFALAVYIARKASDRFGRFLVIGMTFIVFFQAMFNIGVVCEALPTKGMALPFFSYGGTNLVCAFFAVGTILSVGIHSCRDKRTAFVRKVLSR
ncbi:MAG: cell division protein FtsW [Kiritimatiellae bacterium]|nr:cell division protein FtsW [Kiritimatiellia bacterium]